MKEIDFLPEWYRNGRRRQVSYRAQCIALSGVFVVMIVWSLVAIHSISQAQAELTEMATRRGQAENVAGELAGLEDGLRELRRRVESTAEIDSRIDVASILAELSFLIDEKVVLSKVELTAEKFVQKQQAEPSQDVGTVVRAVQTKLSDKKEMPLGNVRFKVVIAGVAADASDVGVLMCKLEDSPYFCQVILAFSRDTEITNRSTPSLSTGANVAEAAAETKGGAREGGTSIQASEFEINCYLANYSEQ
jgi:sensor c-di-GMP phosphodiesterase-like protein